MDPVPVDATHWNLISGVFPGLLLFLALTVNGALSVLLGHAIIPSLAATGQVSGAVQRLRPFLFAIAFVAFAVAIWQLGGMLSQVETIFRDLYPRFVI